MRALEKLTYAASVLRSKGIPYPEKEAEALVADVLDMDGLTLIVENPLLDDERSEELDNCIERRLKGEPLQYIIGFVNFYGLRIRVGKGVLIPRPETELLVEEVLRTGIGNRKSASDSAGAPGKVRILDLCTGSGCIALAIAAHMTHAGVYAVDISDIALEYAGENAGINGIGNVTFLKGHLFEPVRDLKFHIIVSNPPYIKSADIPYLQEEIRMWEPIEALDAGEDGLDYYREIIANLETCLLDRGRCFLEIGFDQRDALEALAGQYGFRSSFRKDFAGHYRIMELSFRYPLM